MVRLGVLPDRADYRLFKLNRMLELKLAGEQFEGRELPEFKPKQQMNYQGEIMVKALFDPQMKWRLVEEYGIDSFEELEDGRLLFQYEFIDKENVFSWILSHGRYVNLLEPEELRDEFRELAKEIVKRYES